MHPQMICQFLNRVEMIRHKSHHHLFDEIYGELIQAASGLSGEFDAAG
jgi:hypothetical protein